MTPVVFRLESIENLKRTKVYLEEPSQLTGVNRGRDSFEKSSAQVTILVFEVELFSRHEGSEVEGSFFESHLTKGQYMFISCLVRDEESARTFVESVLIFVGRKDARDISLALLRLHNGVNSAEPRYC